MLRSSDFTNFNLQVLWQMNPKLLATRHKSFLLQEIFYNEILKLLKLKINKQGYNVFE